MEYGVLYGFNNYHLLINAIFIPKKMTAIEMLTSCLFVGVLVMELDFIVDIKYDVYGYTHKGVQWLSIFIQISIYPAVNIIMLNYFPYKKKLKYKVSYIIVTAVLFTAYEWLTVKVGFLYYNGWKLWYSALCYPVIIIILAWSLSLIRKMIKKDYVRK